MSRRHEQSFLYRHSLGFVAIGLLIVWIIGYRFALLIFVSRKSSRLSVLHRKFELMTADLSLCSLPFSPLTFAL
jgi:hypothetical protein